MLTAPPAPDVVRTRIVIIDEGGELTCHVLLCSRRQFIQWRADHRSSVRNSAVGEIGPFGIALVSGSQALKRFMPLAVLLSQQEGCGSFDL